MKSKKLGLLTTKIGSGITPTGGSFVYQKRGINLIRSQNIYNDRFEENGIVCISQEIADKMKGVEVKEKDVLINITGDSVARTYIVPNEFLPARVNQHVCIIRTNSELNPDYLYYFLINKNTQNHLLSLARSGGTRSALTKEMLENLQIKYPPYEEQIKITKYLNTLNQMIETRKRENIILEKLVFTLFHSWLIDFEFPNEEGKPYKSSGGKMIDSEMGMMPDGWKVNGIDKIANFLNGLPLQKFSSNDSEFLPVIKIKEIKDGITNSTEKASKNIDKRYVIDDGDILFSWSASLEVVIWGHGKGALNQHIFKVNSESFPKWYYYLWLKYYLPKFRHIAKAKATTMGHIQRHHLSEAVVTIPPGHILKNMTNIFGPLLDKYTQNMIENKTLKIIKDIFLPKLLAAEIRISDKQGEIK